MPSLSSVLGVVLLVPASVLGATVKPHVELVAREALGPDFSCNTFGVVEYFSGQRPPLEECIPYYSYRVDEFCRGYLGLSKTVYTTTVTPVSTETSLFTAREIVTTTKLTTIKSISSSTSTRTLTVTKGNPAQTYHAAARRDTTIVDDSIYGVAAPSSSPPLPSGCEELTDDKFNRHAPFIIDAACRCLPRRKTTVSVASTAPARTTTVLTTVTLSSTTTDFTTSTRSLTRLTTTTTTITKAAKPTKVL